MNDNGIINFYANKSEDEERTRAKNDAANLRRVSIDTAHSASQPEAPSFLQRGQNAGYAFSTAVRYFVTKFKFNSKQVRFVATPKVATFHNANAATVITYDSGSDGHYLCEEDRKQLGLLISKQVGVASGGTSKGKCVTPPLPTIIKEGSGGSHIGRLPDVPTQRTQAG